MSVSPGAEVVPAGVDPAPPPQPGCPYVAVTVDDLHAPGPGGWLRLLAVDTTTGRHCVVGHIYNIRECDEGGPDAIRFHCRTQATGHQPSGVWLLGIVDRKGYTIFSTL